MELTCSNLILRSVLFLEFPLSNRKKDLHRLWINMQALRSSILPILFLRACSKRNPARLQHAESNRRKFLNTIDSHVEVFHSSHFPAARLFNRSIDRKRQSACLCNSSYINL